MEHDIVEWTGADGVNCLAGRLNPDYLIATGDYTLHQLNYFIGYMNRGVRYIRGAGSPHGRSEAFVKDELDY